MKNLKCPQILNIYIILVFLLTKLFLILIPVTMNMAMKEKLFLSDTICYYGFMGCAPISQAQFLGMVYRHVQSASRDFHEEQLERTQWHISST